ncbi:uncharacterized protein LOC114746536 [Neltuma alba]|uniref:uncharacterized protein LOC114746536 n=1 Tax=Neltuma alba TaxID=207710 RepID=UPI0010A48473|nr:uncharacterized protein LOC114746536 [Prosopis alba]
MLEYALCWYLGEKQKLWGAAAQVLGLLIEVLGKGFYRHVNSILPVAHRILQSSIECCLCRLRGPFCDGKIAPVDPSAFWSSLEQHEKDRFLKAFDLLDSKKGRSLFLPQTSPVHEQNNQQSTGSIQHVLVSAVLRKMGKIALQMETYQMGIVFNSFKSIMSQISQDDCLHYASEVLLPLYKVCGGLAGKVIPDNMKQLAEESLEKMQTILGTQNFVQVYNLIGKKLKAKRDKKKQEEKIMAVINPMRNAKRKMRISAKNRANKKRKIMTLKMARWMH